MTIGVEWVLAQQFILLVLIPMPLTLLFLAIALPLRKDQPMEIWLAAVVRFFIKPRLKMWWPEGEINLVTIVAPVTKEVKLFKDLTAEEANQRFEDLAEVIDTQGWSRRGISDYNVLADYSKLQDTTIAEASQVQDVMDKTEGVGLQFDSLIEEQEKLHRRMTTERFQQDMRAAVEHAADTAQPTEPEPVESQPLQSVDQTPATPLQPQAPPQPPIAEAPPPTNTSALSAKTAILNLSHNTLSVSSLSKEANRIDRLNEQDEVVIDIHR